MIAGDDDDAHTAVTPHKRASQPRYQTSIRKEKKGLLKGIPENSV
jgi:hypothetical protein